MNIVAPQNLQRSAHARAARRHVVGLLFMGMLSSASAYSAEKTEKKDTRPVRNFYEVLGDLVSDFEIDLKNGEVQGTKNLAIRNIATSENIPVSFKSHLELLVSERILQSTKSRLLQCLPCRSKRTSLNGDQVVITSAETNPVELSRIAKLAGIENFMDIAFSYQSSGMVLSMYIVEPEGGSILWSRSYNSETSRSSAARRGVDYSQIDESKKKMEYRPTLQFRGTLYYMFQPDLSGYTGCLGVGFRMVERYNNRKQEVGFELDYFLDSSILAGSGAADSGLTSVWQSFNLTLLFMHAWNFIGDEENYSKARGSLFAGIGGSYASGFLGGLIRVGYEWRLGKHWGLHGSAGYRPPAGAFLDSTEVGTVHGAEFGVGVSGIF